MTEEQKTFADQKRKTVETAEFTEDGRYKRKVRSFVLRTGRLSDFQKNMMNDHWADLGLDYQNAPFDFATIYGGVSSCLVADYSEFQDKIFYQEIEIQQGESLLLCSDGLTDGLSADVREKVWKQYDNDKS